MKSRLRSLRTIVGVRERQQTRLEAALSAQRALMAEREAALAQSMALHGQCAAVEQAAIAQRGVLLGGHFMPQHLMALELRLKSLVADTASAAKALAKSQQALEQQQAAVGAAQRAVRRNAQRIESYRERIASLLRDQDLAVEEAVDEETGETFAARLMARRRATREEARGA